MKPVAIGGPQTRSWDRYRELRKPFCNIAGGVISPLLANLFLHYAFDVWMRKHFPDLQFERYCDDAVVHCKTEKQAQFVREAIAGRLAQCGLEVNPDKTRIVYCKDVDRRAT